MEEDAAKASAKPPHNLVLEFPDDQYSPIEQAALANNETVREWAKRSLNEAASADMETIAAEITQGNVPVSLPNAPQSMDTPA